MPKDNLEKSKTDIDQIAEELEESQKYLAAIFATVQVGILVLDAETHAIVDANPKAVELIGASKETMTGALCHKFVCPANRGNCLLMDPGQTITNSERILVKANGEVIPIILTIAPTNLHGRPHLIQSFQDVSEFKRIQDSLRESEARYYDLFENANDLIQSVDPNGRFLYVNRAWKETMGYSDQEIAELTVFDVIAPRCQDHCMAIFKRVMSGETIHRIEAEFSAKDGRIVILEGSVNCNFIGGKPVATRNIFRDITDRKRAEKELEEWNRTLETKVEEKTRHLREAHDKLLQWEKMATVSEVISGAAHELNNPIAGILGAIHLLRGSSLAKPIDPALMAEIDVLESMENAATRCRRIVEDLTRFSMQSSCQFSEMDINQVIRDALEVMNEQFALTNTKVTWKPDLNLPAVEGDSIKLFEVFVNILQNSKNAMLDQGKIKINAQLLKTYGEIPRVAISIRDSGCGIPAENLSRIFEPFFTTKPVGKGPGLGLTVSYGVVKKHHGDIEVRSTVGKGTEVVVTLPLKQPAA